MNSTFEGKLIEPPTNRDADRQVEEFKKGNQRFINGAVLQMDSLNRVTAEQKLKEAGHPRALVLCNFVGLAGSPERVFDTMPGEIVVQRVAGVLAGRQGGELQASLDFMANHMCQVPLILVLADEQCPCLAKALDQGRAKLGLNRCAGAQIALDQLFPATLRALQLFERLRQKRGQARGFDANEDELQLRSLGAEQVALYSMERVLCDNDSLRTLVLNGELSLEGAVLRRNGSVKFLGPHQDQQKYLSMRPVSERLRRLRYNSLNS